ncbi:MAG: ArnT family glycosyltransferase [Brevinematia bacterium]
MLSKNYKYFFILVVLVSGFNILWGIWDVPVQEWDESRHGVNAFEMLSNHRWYANYYDGKPDYWNLKTPLGSWLILTSYSIFGVNPFSLRFFSSLSALVLVVLVMIFAKRKFGSEVSLLSGFVLSTTISFVHFHGARTGDFDAIFTLLVFLSLLFADKSVESKNYFYLSVLVFPFSFLLKSFASIMVILVIAFYYFYGKMYKKLKIYEYFILFLIATLPILFWAYHRWQFDGIAFFERMISYDVIERGTKSIEGHSQFILFYAEPLFLKFLPWSLLLIFVPFYFIYLSFSREREQFKIELSLKGILAQGFVWIYLVSVLLPAFLVKTKTEWYVMPVFPILSIIVSCFIVDVLYKNLDGFWMKFRNFLKVGIWFFIIIAEIFTLIFTLNSEFRVFQYKSVDFEGAKKEKELQKILTSDSIPAGAKVGLVGANITQSYMFLSRCVKRYTLTTQTNEADYLIMAEDLKLIKLDK